MIAPPLAAIEHGGRLAEAEARFGRPAEGWLDLSTGINPWPYPVPAIPADAWARLPGRAGLDALLAAAARRYGAGAGGAVVAAPGTQPLIQIIPQLLPAGRVAVLEPTYGEHALRWAAAGHRTMAARRLDEAADADHAVIVNPNNPDGRTIAPSALAALADRYAAHGGWLVVDEAFADVAPEISTAPLAGRPGLCVLRSFGKFYGLAGLRLGFALAPATLVARLETALGPWAVSGPAITVGTTALADDRWADATRQRLADAGARLDRLLAAAGLAVIGGTSLFRLAHAADAAARAERLGRHGILVRSFARQPGWLRFGLPPTPDAERRLAQALTI